jgi:hypothetical protein
MTKAGGKFRDSKLTDTFGKTFLIAIIPAKKY